MTKVLSRFASKLVLLLVFLLCASSVPAQHKMDGVTKARVKRMLKNVEKEIIKNYYDPTYHGMDVEKRFEAAKEKLENTEDIGRAFAVIAQAVLDLNDSHTRFFPPSRAAIVSYGWRMRIYDDRAFITGVQEESDAAKKGLEVGDEVLKLNGFHPTRKDLWKMIYYYQTLNPQTKLSLEVRKPGGETKVIEADAKITRLKAMVDLTDSLDLNAAGREGAKLASNYKHYFSEMGTALVWKMPDFAFDPINVDGFIGRAKGKSTLILDLRGNPGGYVKTLEELAGYFFSEDTKIADLKGRKEMDPQMAKTQGSDVFKGKVIVLVDSASASAAEIFARLMQITKRGIVLGDVSAGAVMQSQSVGFDAGVTTQIPYGMSLTNADVIMTDGKSIEHVGVTPDELIIPTAEDLQQRRDPVLARALELAGVKIDAAAAGKIFPEEKFIERQSNIAINFQDF